MRLGELNERDAYLMLIIVIMLTFTVSNLVWMEYCSGFTTDGLLYVPICANIYEGMF